MMRNVGKILFTRRKWIVAASLLIIMAISGLGGSLLFNASLATPVENYARSQNLPSSVVSVLKPFDDDHQMNASDKAVVALAEK